MLSIIKHDLAMKRLESDATVESRAESVKDGQALGIRPEQPFAAHAD
jgi:hypothetical protein